MWKFERVFKFTQPAMVDGEALVFMLVALCSRERSSAFDADGCRNGAMDHGEEQMKSCLLAPPVEPTAS